MSMPRAAILLLALAFSGCATVVIPPAHLAHPSPVFIADYGRHSSLVLSRGEGRLVEYSYGQFAWYALERDEWWRVPALLFVPQQGGLGREEWDAPATAWGVKRRRWLEELLRVEVERDEVEALLARLDARFEAGRETSFRNNNYGFDFVYDDDLYWVGHSCNAAVAEWLEELGCEVPSVAISANYEVRPSPSPPEPPLTRP